MRRRDFYFLLLLRTLDRVYSAGWEATIQSANFVVFRVTLDLPGDTLGQN
jgi:hypothetical protein